MAEFGAIASGIGVVGVAGQILSGIKKLRDFQKDVKNAPEDIALLADELELLTTNIASIEQQIQQYPTVAPTSPTSALHFSQRAIVVTAMIVQDLNNEITKRKTIGSLKAAWKQKTMENYMTRIERAKSTLSLASSFFLHELQQHTIRQMGNTILQKQDQQQDQVDRRFDQLVTITHTTTSYRTSRMESESKVEERANDTCDASVTTDHANSTQYRLRSKTTIIRVANFRLSLPYWLLSRSLDIEIHRSARGWTMNLNPRRLVPEDCEFFEAGEAMNLPRMRQLLEQGQASVHDVDRFGQNVLHYVFYYSCASMSSQQLEQILDFGLDLNAVDDNGWTPLSRAFDIVPKRNLIMDHFAPEVFEGQDGEVTAQQLLQVYSSEDANQAREGFALDLLTRLGVSRTERFLISQRSITDCYMNMERLTNWFQEWQIGERWHECEASVQRHIAVWLGSHLTSSSFSGSEISGEILISIIKSSMEREWEACPIVWFVASMYAAHQYWKIRPYEDLIALFARYIAGNGINLLDLGKVIQKGLRHSIWRWDAEYFSWPRARARIIRTYPGYRSRIISFAYGEAPEDWAINFVSFVEDAKVDIFREFWDMVEHPERSMPGSWNIEKEHLSYDPDLVLSTEYRERKEMRASPRPRPRPRPQLWFQYLDRRYEAQFRRKQQ